MSETHEHLEQAEHAGHGGGHAIDPFTLRVAMTMAIIAAVLAAISLLGHRKHNEALQRQGNANRMRTESAAYEVKSSNQFAWYQAKRARRAGAELHHDDRAACPAPDSKPLRDDQVKKWKDYIKKNDTKPADIKLDSEGMPGESDDTGGALIVRGKHFEAKAKEKQKEADHEMEEYEHVHHQADGLDGSHLTVELGLVLCTICVLTKRREFWLAGILAAIIGLGLAAQALLMTH